MIETATTRDQLAALAELHALLDAHRIPYWIFGGWAVDFHVGRVTRAHTDLDVAVWEVDHARFAELLIDAGWPHRPEMGEDEYTCYVRDTVRLEVAVLARDVDGAIYTPLRDGRAEWPADSFGEDVATLCGVRARLIGRAALVTEKSVDRSDPVSAAKDRADVAHLSGQP